MCFRSTPVVLACVLAAGCTPLTPDRNAAVLTSLRPAQACIATLPFFGHYKHIGERNDRGMYMPPDGRITMRNDGGWCTIRHAYTFNNVVQTPPMTLIDPPQQGRVELGSVGGELWLAYQPLPGFVGPDKFQVRLAAPVPETIPVTVTVQP